MLTELSGDPYHHSRQESREIFLKKLLGTEELFTNLPVCRDGSSFFNDDDVTWDNLAGQDLLLFSLANNLAYVSTKE
jgi:hypothetical protein